MDAEIGYNEWKEMRLKFPNTLNLLVFVTPPKVGRIGVNLTAANCAVLTQKFWVLNKPRQAVAQVVQLGHNRVLQT
jgi:hypothetical protein